MTARLPVVAIAAIVLFALSSQATAAQRPAAVFRAACRGDITILCPGVKPGEGRLRACLVANRSRLSPDCRTAFAALLKARRAAAARSTLRPQAPN